MEAGRVLTFGEDILPAGKRCAKQRPRVFDFIRNGGEEKTK